ncbi:spore coat protein [Brevibacillus sp. SYSU BS000544]|uniref:spore coat protein n=1 Tax=Brevibacillus sp. SYSU BS000544 TaxID=3416443 RepID=UPI003CE46775
MHTYPYGAHEVMELHDVLTNTINTINTFQLYYQNVKDRTLRQIINNQLQFMTDEYNQVVHFVHGLATGTNTTAYHSNISSQPLVSNIAVPKDYPQTIHQQMDDRDIASCILTLHKAGAAMRMHATLECADATIRQMMLQCANNCAHQAYEIWGYLHSQGHYAVPTLADLSNRHVLRGFHDQPPYQQTTTQEWETHSQSSQSPFNETVFSSGFETPNQNVDDSVKDS